MKLLLLGSDTTVPSHQANGDGDCQRGMLAFVPDSCSTSPWHTQTHKNTQYICHSVTSEGNGMAAICFADSNLRCHDYPLTLGLSIKTAAEKCLQNGFFVLVLNDTFNTTFDRCCPHSISMTWIFTQQTQTLAATFKVIKRSSAKCCSDPQIALITSLCIHKETFKICQREYNHRYWQLPCFRCDVCLNAAWLKLCVLLS